MRSDAVDLHRSKSPVTRLGLSDEDQQELLPSGRQTRLANRVAWAKIYLERAGLLDSPERRRFVITERGREVLARPPERIDIRFVGALHGRRARKGVFITTSRFTPDAVSYVATIDPRVVLVDGEKLARS